MQFTIYKKRKNSNTFYRKDTREYVTYNHLIKFYADKDKSKLLIIDHEGRDITFNLFPKDAANY